jgi:hypothetical protein
MLPSRRVRLALVFVCIAAASLPLWASDHVDSPNNAEDRAADLLDGYMFLDPNDNSRVVMLMTIAGFITPGENTNLGAVFSDDVRFTFDIENTGDANIDGSIYVTFGPKTAPATPQLATIVLPDGHTFTAPASPANNTSETAPAPVVTTDPVSNVSFFAGLVDDPFFFDIPGFSRFVGSVRAGAPNPTFLQRGRDSFAGFNALGIALSVPAARLRGSAGNVVRMQQTSQRRLLQVIGPDGNIHGSGRWVNADRQGFPAINTVLIPFARKREYNFSSPADDAAGRFAGDLVASLTGFGTNATNIGILAGLAVAKGDMLSLDTSIANTGPGGGTNPQAAFPNGRRLRDDVIDTILFFVANQNTLGDSVNANDIPFADTFPFFGATHQPLASGCATQD